MKTTIKKSDFSFAPSGRGHYRVTYCSPVTGKKWSAYTSNMPLIDATKNQDQPKKIDLEILKKIVKSSNQ